MSNLVVPAPAASAAPAETRPKKPRTGVVASRRARWGWVFVAPFGIFLVVFLITPLIYSFILSLQNKTVATGNQWVWFANYAKAFSDPLFLEGVWLVVRFALILIPIQMLVSLIAALMLDALTSRFSRFARLMIFVPYAVPAVIGALMWGFLYSPSFGPATEVFGWLGLDAPNLLGKDSIFGSLVNVVTWQWAGYYMIIIYAALQGIDPAVYEAARLDGASAIQTALRIKIPMISSSMVLILVFALIGTLQFFTEPQILRSLASGSIDASYTPNIYAYTLAFSYNQFNYASAISFALGLVVFLGSYLFLMATKKRNGLS
ncbi:MULTISPECIES: carbohydrate ABC transporter permease [Rathayibacter]|uniref:Sugar ABC transporter permease n=2 Tax=Rathayibacter festucae TaxID=110937 RepID=A0A3Q9UYE6_9MICO|nr:MULTISPECIES: sugar ABC transporter permease [Rathayibacter]AZZ53238.1 sugar ABC transporter permease [Rathayibacter festucae DSM 15932]QHC61448.1 ABC transporter permease subunit [Rathayibacter festucae]ROQ50483.1 multiple sugar transport system permease protein [Rathayibacter sp. PhB152]ROS19301.1 multiple sugar transport system permease protein [Rathayibacter sp. PhB127]TDX82033.1 multiple sugar transport system permease protein [Rathayibacter sp. PhB151]